MRLIRPSRIAIVALFIASGVTPAAQAGDWLFNHCHTDCCDTTVKLPAQKVVVETAAPRVTVQESTRANRGLTTPVLGTIYMPMAMPIAGQKDSEATQEDNPLRAVHAAELAQRVLDRLSDCSKPQTDTIKPQPDVAQKVKDVTDKIDKLADRLNAVEKMSRIHENYLSEEIQKANPTKP